ncbi:MAG: hypothetical protein NC342_08430 [Pseudoflavonifractor sp.]|nr:hypothetical protein [Alloprevotella sp.]MCM1117547.1 hypothetical protein [Pseudoflavonifractor sp.]
MDINNQGQAASEETAAASESQQKGCPRCQKCFPRTKLHSFDWLADIPGSMAESDLVEVAFKNTRKGFYRNTLGLDLNIGDMVAVEAAPGHDIGRVTLTGRLVELQMRRAGVKATAELKRVFRLAKPGDLDKFNEARARENDTMVRARRIADELHLNMKIGDVEYQGDGNKAIFYYIADERVDFRQLIRILADTFKVRIEMKQIGARQEAGRIGGIGPCGRPLCCASWMSNFVTVGTAAARYQDISLNPQKLAGQCAKLKCCLNFEVDAYMESLKKLPGKEIRLETEDKTYYHFKYDIFKQEVTYSSEKNSASDLVTISAARAFEIIALNKAGEKPTSLLTDEEKAAADKPQYNDILGQDITRFDKKKKSRRQKEKDKAPKDTKEPREAREPREQKEPKDPKAPKSANTPKGPKEPREPQGDKQRKPRRERQRNKGFRPEDDTPEGVPAPRASLKEEKKEPKAEAPSAEVRQNNPSDRQPRRQRRKGRPGQDTKGDDSQAPSKDAKNP